MPRGRPTKTSFKAGNQEWKKRVAKGVTRTELEAFRAIKIDAAMIENYITQNSHLSPHELVARLRNERVSILEAMLIKAMLKGYRNGDVAQLSFFLDRLVGKVPNKIEHEVKNPYKDMSMEELMAEKKKVTELNRKTTQFLETTNERIINQMKQLEVYTNGNGNGAHPTTNGSGQGKTGTN